MVYILWLHIVIHTNYICITDIAQQSEYIDSIASSVSVK